ncbi:aspartate/glutamate racemase family protein [Variovorax atrisoli]|uniref:aspartate/glutamate racemase family protein n=1 Tax=Variovorax atrisoli TaxID=3394203 RepID=UPI000F7D8E55|nr:amino acid racemase [Variovorax sp. 369]RTD98734.1 aspartate/glutamate racemase family protein [Variovorax sp. 369]
MSGQQPSSAPRALGILGGMGPLAGATFALRMVQLTEAAVDQDHIPTILCNDPRIPDRSSAMLQGGESPLPAMQRGIRLLETAGAGCIAVPCNTAHLWFDDLKGATHLPLLNIAEAVVQDLRGHELLQGKVGVLGTPATLALGLYQRALEQAGYEAIVPAADDVQRHCVAAIAAVKAGQLDAAWEPAAQGIRALVARGAKAVVLGCTELPLAVPHHRRGEFDCVLTDSIDALALAAIAHCRRGH